MQQYILVFIGGGLGSICRYGIAHLLSAYKWDFPWATFIANALACIILGIMVGLQLKSGVSDTQKFLIMTGFCGGFSTFSTFSYETFQLFENGNHLQAFTNIFLSLLVCFFCIYLGIKIVR